MEEKLQNPSNGGGGSQLGIMPDLQNPNHDDESQILSSSRFADEIDSSCSTPYVSAPSSPGRIQNGYYFSAPASPMHYILSSASRSADLIASSSSSDHHHSGSSEFEFSARFPSSSTTVGSMISADELFLNGQIRPMKLSSHLQRPQVLAPLIDVEAEDEEDKETNDLRRRESRLRNRSVHRRARSLSPLRNSPLRWREEEDDEVERRMKDLEFKDLEQKQEASAETTPSVSASSSRSSSSGRNSKRWIFLKDLLYRSKSEGRGNGKEKFWYSISFSPKEKKPPPPSSSSSLPFYPFRDRKKETSEQQKQKTTSSQTPAKKSTGGKPTNGVGKRRVPPSPHELHYTTNRAQMEELRKKTYLPYRQGLLGCLGFTSKSYGAMNGLAKTLNPVSSR